MDNFSKDNFSKDRAELLEALGHPTRIRILKVLTDSPRGFSELKKALDIESGGLLQFHLGKLQALGLVKDTSERGYALTDEGKEALRIVANVDFRNNHISRRIYRKKAKILAIMCVLTILISAGYGYYLNSLNQLSAAVEDVNIGQMAITDFSLSPDSEHLALKWEAYCTNPTDSPLYLRLEVIEFIMAIDAAHSQGNYTCFTLEEFRNPPYEEIRIEPHTPKNISGTLEAGPPLLNATQLYGYLAEQGIGIEEVIMRVTFWNGVPFVEVEKTMSLSHADISLRSN